MEKGEMKNRKMPFLLLLLLLLGFQPILAQQAIRVTGVVVDDNGETVPGATIVLKNDKSTGTSTDIDGKFTISVPEEGSILVVSFVGMKTQEVKATSKKLLKIELNPDTQLLDEYVVVGYGQQKKASSVGAITQTDGKTLERAGGVTNVAAALTGKLPGVITYSSSGMPGEEDPRIVIRTQTSWNSSDPLILVDGIERSMSDVDISTVENISVLKDASATAVFGVKGANGVILITTKRGQEGKAEIRIRANMTAKLVSKLPEKFDAYDTFYIKNDVLEHELPSIGNTIWGEYKPTQIIDKYRHPLNSDEWDRYPNVDWEDALFKSYAMSYNASVSVSGGTKLVKYFTSADFISEGDLFHTFQNNRGYTPSYSYNRINVRSNLDFQLTKTTTFSANLYGSNAVRVRPWNAGDQHWNAAYMTAPDAMRPIYSDGTWGFYSPRDADVPNSMYNLAVSGIGKTTNVKIQTDFKLRQSLAFITKGLSLTASYSYDQGFQESGRGINDLYNYGQQKWIDPISGQVFYKQPTNSGTQLDFMEQVSWSTSGGSVDTGQVGRRINYQVELNYGNKFGQHEVTGLALFKRQQYANGGEFLHYREDWVFRGTYSYMMRYMAEINGAYNGTEKFGPKNRFALFPSLSAGWMISEEKFVKDNVKFLDMLKVRASWGKIGDDNAGGRFLYTDQWSYGGTGYMGNPPVDSPYTIYRITTNGNPDISWEKSTKQNYGIEYGLFGGLVTGSFDYFTEKRTDILVGGGSRAIPSYLGTSAPTANIGSTKAHGYEFEVRLNYRLANGMRLWANTNFNHATNEVLFRDDPVLLPAYQRSAGFAIGQNKGYIDSGYLLTWDDVYGSTERSTNNTYKLVGDYNILDFNGDGIIDSYDSAPYGYSGVPQNTYSTTIGFEYKGFSASLQFYGTNNVMREVTFPSFRTVSNVAYVEGTYWSKEGGASGLPMMRWGTQKPFGWEGTRYMYDGSYVRLKNAELSYNFTGRLIKSMGLRSARLYLNGTNLLLWTDMPDDRESNFSGGSGGGAYPSVRRVNLGLEITL